MKIKPLKLMKDKKGGIGLIIFFFVLLGVVVLGFIGAMVVSVIGFASDEITPVMEGLGMVGDTNVSQAAEFSFGVADTFIQTLPWLLGFGYVLALIFTLVFIFIAGYQPHPAFMGFYFVLMILLIFGCVIMSNMYQDIYTGTDEIATRLQAQTITSFMILHSPMIMVFIAIIGGILMFARHSTETSVGGFGV
jgi:hypothetical protein